MKVIDLLNKIANGEIEENKEYLFYGSDYCTIREFFNRYIVDKENLNLKVETLGEDNKIRKLDFVEEYTFSKRQNEMANEDRRLLDSNFRELGIKINEIIDKLNEMENE